METTKLLTPLTTNKFNQGGEVRRLFFFKVIVLKSKVGAVCHDLTKISFFFFPEAHFLGAIIVHCPKHECRGIGIYRVVAQGAFVFINNILCHD